MTSFPTLIPSSRTFSPGSYPHSTFAGMSGVQGRVRNSNVMLASQLRLSFVAITEAQMLSILAHYQGRRGGFQSFLLPESIWNGLSSVSDYQLPSYGWIYTEPPTVADAMCADAYDVELSLESVPPEGTALLGLNSIVRFSIAGGIASAANGASLTVTAWIEHGAGAVAGLAQTVDWAISEGNASTDAFRFGLLWFVDCSLTPGVATGGASEGLAATVNWTLAAGTASAAGTDPDFANVSLLLHMDGSNNSTTITDSSSNGHTISVFGDAKLTTSDKKYGTAALTLDGTGDYLTVPAGSDFELGTGDFTVECWCKPAVISDNDGLFTFGGTSSGLYVALYQDNWYMGTGGGGSSNMGSASSDLNTWRHVAVTRSGTALKLFIDGVQKGSTITDSTNLSDNQLKIGYYFSSSYPFTGLIDEFRVTKGVARYTANFTPPTAPFPDS